MQEEIQRLHELRKLLDANLKSIKEYEIANNNLKQLIKDTEMRIQKQVIIIATTDNKNADIIKGTRCFICGKTASNRCYVCHEGDIPSGYCDNHKSFHGNEHQYHTAIWIYLATEIKEVKPRMSDDEKLERLEKLMQEMKDTGKVPPELAKILKRGKL